MPDFFGFDSGIFHLKVGNCWVDSSKFVQFKIWWLENCILRLEVLVSKTAEFMLKATTICNGQRDVICPANQMFP